MMIYIDLDNEEEDVVMADKVENTNILKKKFIFKKKLVLAVRKHRILYDNKHKFFTNVAKKELIWQQIAKHLKTDVDVCKQTWIELRYSYQCHARRLQNYFLNGHKHNSKRPAMGLELELMFLWRFIEDRKTSNLPFDISDVIAEAEKELVQESNETEIQIEMEIESADPENKSEIEDVNKDKDTAIYKEIDEDLILIEQPVELIVIDEDDDNGKSEKQFKMSDSMKKLVQQIKSYPELYDSDHVVYNDYSHRSNIWNSIATFLGDKATKLMKCWIIMQTRYEWEIMHINTDNVDRTPTELQKELEFLKGHILKNRDTVYKQSYYLKTQWYDPIDYFKEIYNLIVRMKKTSEVVFLTDLLLKSKEKNKEYLTLWSEIATSKGCSAGQCEVTWLIMRYFYWELMSMRQQKYKLTDKWYFETIITELYAIAKVTQSVKQHEQQVLKAKKPYKISSKSYSVSGSKSKSRNSTTTTATITTTAVSQNNSIVTTAPTITTTNYLHSMPVTSSTITTSTATLPVPLPKITAAISLAPQVLSHGSLHIKQISGHPCVNINQSVNGAISTSRVSSMPATLIQQQTQIQTSMQMPYNLPNQLKVTTVPLSTTSISAIRPLVATTTQSAISSTAPTLLSIRTKAPAPTQIVQKVNFMPTLTPATIQSTVRPIMTSSVQSYTPATIQQPTVQPIMTTAVQTSVATSRGSVIPPPTQPTTSFAISTITPVPPLSMITNPTAPAVNSKITTVSTSIPSPASSSSTSTANISQLPKISGAASLLNPNEVLIELIASQNGNHLVVHGPPLTTKYQLPMPTVARFIREVLGVPLLHNKRVSQPITVNNYWELIAKKFNLPVHICRACWNFLLENFNHFPQIAPLKEVMRPFPTTINVWMESTVLFKEFDEHCLAMGWKPYMSCIPEVVECIGGYPVLYQDISKDNNDKQSDMEALCAWRTINLRFPKIPPLKEIWKSIKVCFCQYMADIELNIENKWSLNWWRAFARLKFLVEAKYSTNEPFYYIVSNKMVEEIERCAMLEMKERYKKDLTVEETPAKCDNEVPKPESEEKPVTPAPIENLVLKKDIELNTLLTAMQKHPAIFEKANSNAKYEAWKQVAKELHMEVVDCLMSFKRATQMYYAFKKQDPVNNCRLNEKYYKKLDKIIRTISSNKASSSRCSKLNVKTPFELNQSLDSASSTCSDYVFPERFIPEISMTNSPSDLVVKNWIYALGNRSLNDTVKGKLQKVLKKYIKNVNDHHSYS